jgi:hypothetical protein
MILNTNAPIISVKKISDADFGITRGHQTHIGLFENTFKHINFDDNELLISYSESVKEKQYSLVSQLVYKNRSFETLSLLAYINNGVGEFRSPRIRSGNQNELNLFENIFESTYNKIKEIASQDFNKDWFLAIITLETNEIAFLLFNEESDDYTSVENIIGEIGPYDNNGNWRKHISKESPIYNRFIQFLNTRIELSNIEYFEELEIASQTGEDKVTRRVIPRVRDIEKANKLFKDTGLKGEELLYKYFELQKNGSIIKDFKWMNQSKETGMPYDFEITNLDNSIVFSDAKSTSYKFELPIILSSGELNFINDNKDKYLIHRLYSINEEPKLRVCDNIHTVSDIFIPNYEILNQSLNQERLSTRGIKLAVPTDLQILNFNNEILLNANA